MKSLAVTFAMLAPAEDDLHRLRHLHPHIFREPGIENVGRADSEGHAAHRADMRRVGIGADIELTGQRIALE